MQNLIKYFASYFKLIWTDLLIDPYSNKFINFCNNRWPRINDKNRKSEILVELYSVDQTILAFSYAANILANLHRSKIVSFTISARSDLFLFLRYRRINKIYQSFNVNSRFNLKLSKSIENNSEIFFNSIYKKLKNKYDVLNIKIHGDIIGNEIYEAYLRRYSSPTIEIDKIEFKLFLKQCLNEYFFWDNYFTTHNVKAIILSHGIYEYGITRIIANRYKIPVYLPTVRSFFCLKSQSEIGLPLFDKYHTLFNSLTFKEQKIGINWAKKRLDLRFSGAVGVDMTYSTLSAFKKGHLNTRVLRENNRIKILIATHCFFDNPNAYGRNLFPDFYEWICYLGNLSSETNYDWYLKTHPDILPGNQEVINELLSQYKNIIQIPSDTSHLQLIDEGTNFILTVYGSVGHEYPLFGKTVINAGVKNPHIAYSFNIHANSISEYRKILLNLKDIKHKINKKSVYEFYYMHHKYFGYNNLFFKSFDDFISMYPGNKQNSSIAYEYFLDNFNTKDDELLCGKIQKFILSKTYKYYDHHLNAE